MSNPLEATQVTIWDIETGRILRTVTAPFQDVQAQAAASNEGVIEGHYEDDKFIIVVGEGGPEAAEITEPPAVTRQELYRERDRRFALGMDYDFGDERGTHRITLSDADMKGWNQVTTWATVQVVTGNLAAWLMISTSTGQAAVTPIEWLTIVNAATGFLDPIWQASFVLEAMDPIPQDFRDDEWWQP